MGALSHEAKFQQDAKPRSIYSVWTQYTVWVDKLGRSTYVRIYIPPAACPGLGPSHSSLYIYTYVCMYVCMYILIPPIAFFYYVCVYIHTSHCMSWARPISLIAPGTRCCSSAAPGLGAVVRPPHPCREQWLTTSTRCDTRLH